ncbi:MAG TPA: SDR family oxidoreductase, partial [Acidimicrobiales bacterium]|nr:SDR family oxidoreductase [Acidimicrobiales bacterium]
TGAGRGIGREHALLFASLGAKVVVNDLGGAVDGSGADISAAQSVVDEITAAGGEAVANTDSVSSFEGAKAMVEQAVSTFGDLHIVVNNAGILRDRMSFNMSEEDFDDVVRVHLKGHFAMARTAGAYWREQHKAGEAVTGRIINTTSEAGLFGSAGQANYASAKGGIATLTITLARELERFGVTVNAIAPRARTRMTAGIFNPSEAADTAFDNLAPENVAPIVVWLATDEAASINGQFFVVWGGSVNLVAPYSPVASLRLDRAWTPAELLERQGELFGSRSSGIPAFPYGA